jgi:hypothetical protein
MENGITLLILFLRNKKNEFEVKWISPPRLLVFEAGNLLPRQFKAPFLGLDCPRASGRLGWWYIHHNPRFLLLVMFHLLFRHSLQSSSQ